MEVKRNCAHFCPACAEAPVLREAARWRQRCETLVSAKTLPCRAGQVQESSARCLLHQGPGASPGVSLVPFWTFRKGPAPQGGTPLTNPVTETGPVEGRPLIRHGFAVPPSPLWGEGLRWGHGICRDTFPLRKGVWELLWGPSRASSRRKLFPLPDGEHDVEHIHPIVVLYERAPLLHPDAPSYSLGCKVAVPDDGEYLLKFQG